MGKIINLLLLMKCLYTTSIQTEQLSHFPFPIDIVYLWVDGSDTQWQDIKNYYHALLYGRIPAAADEFSENRFADHEELRYSLRSIIKFAPFVNHIYIVTMNQKPYWLKPHPQISIIDHTEIFTNQDDLPTFNSHALESNLHRIPHLSEFYIYFNDDVFLGAPVTPYDFFTVDGKVNVLFERSLSPSGPPIPDETAYRRAWRNTNAYLDAHFTVEPRHRLSHSAFAVRKSFVEATETACSAIFTTNSSHKFRCNQDYNMVNGFLQYYWSYYDLIRTGSISNMMVSLRDDTQFEKTKKNIARLKKNKPHTFCLQDVMGNNSSKTQQLLQKFLQESYPDPAPWE